MEQNQELISYINNKIMELSDLAEIYLKEDDIHPRKEYYKIEKYVEDFLNDESSERFIIMPGLRGVGKTTILFQIYQYLMNQGISDTDILYFDVNELCGLFDEDIFNVVSTFS